MRIEHVGSAKSTVLVAELGGTAADLVINCSDCTNWPVGSIGPFYVSLNKGTATEEKVLCSGRSGNVVQVWTDGVSTGRGADSTVAQVHPINSTIEHVWTATEADEANAHLTATATVHGVTGALAGATQTQTLTNKTMSGASNTFSNIPAAAVVGLSTDYATLTTAQTLTNKTLTAPVVTLATNAQGGSYTLVLTDAGKIVEMSGGGTLTVPLNASVAFPVGTQILIMQTGASQVTVAGTGGVTVNATPGLKLRTQWSVAALVKRATDTWVLSGDVTA